MLPALTTPRMTIEHMALPHAALLADFFRRNEHHLAPWDPPRGAGVYGLAFWEHECELAVEQFFDGAVARWVLLSASEPVTLIGRINYTQIFRGPFQSCMLGYAIDAQHEGQGLMAEALQATNAYMFEVQRLHRIQANHLPENVRSAELLARLGFRREGLAHDYLFINGAWRDHVINALINPEFDQTGFLRTITASDVD